MKSDEKKEARKTAEAVLSSLRKKQRESAAAAACTNLKATPYWRNARSILAYLAFGSELDADPVIQAALDEGKYVYVPRIRDRQMSFHRVESLEEPFPKGVFGIREPLPDSPEWHAFSSPGPTLVLVPGLQFDMSGGRLGRGGGYYDRFLSGIRMEAETAGEVAPLCIAYAYREQIVESVPREEYDEFVDGLVSDGFSGLF